MEKLGFNTKEKELLKRLGVSALILFGSRAQDVATKASDFDFGVLLSDAGVLFSSKERKKIYDSLYDLLSSKIKQLVNIDIVFLQDAPFELRSHVVKYGLAVFEADARAFPRFRQHTIILCADFAPFREEFNKATLSRITL